MNRRGQIFLIMTILVISFMIGITSVLVDIRRTDYLDPSPDSDETLRSWEIAVDAIEQIMDVKTTIATQQGLTSSPIDITDSLDNVVRYLNERGVSATITVENGVGSSGFIDYQIQGNGTQSTVARTTGIFDIFINSGSTEISQTVNKTLSFHADAPDADNVYIYKKLDSDNYFISGADFNASPVVDNSNGSYDVSGISGLTTITLPNNLLLYITIP